MRWEQLRADGARAGELPLGLPAAAVGGGRAGLRRPGPEPITAGIGDDAVAIEVQAKSIINRVPGSSRMAFQWTINPYRGCTHACRYCLWGETPVLMAHGGTQALADLRVGDEVYGTFVENGVRRAGITQVQAHWQTVKPGHLVTLDDGRELMASGDHRFLTTEGWKHVTGGAPGGADDPERTGGPVSRPGLVVGDTLVGLKGGGRVVSVVPVGFELPMYDITTGTGDFIANGVVSHNCFARNTHTYLDLDAGHDFDTKIVVKVNAGRLLRRELATPGWRGESIAMGTNVDCYQRAEGRYRLMREILSALRDHANPYSILTKGTLIQRDLDLITAADRVTDVSIAFSVGFLDEETWRAVEPGTPQPSRRLDVVRRFADAGIRCSVLMAPILPGLTDTDAEVDRTVAAIAAAGARGVTPLVLHLRPGAREWYGRWLAREHPGLVPRYRALYRRGAYAPAGYQREVTARVRAAARRHGLAGPAETFRRPDEEPPAAVGAPDPAPAGEQLSLM
jgi:DNA repair photolyase